MNVMKKCKNMMYMYLILYSSSSCIGAIAKGFGQIGIGNMMQRHSMLKLLA